MLDKIKNKKQEGPVIQSIVSLTESLVKDSLSLLVCTQSSMLIFLADKISGTFALCKSSSHFFRKIKLMFLSTIRLKF